MRKSYIALFKRIFVLVGFSFLIVLPGMNVWLFDAEARPIPNVEFSDTLSSSTQNDSLPATETQPGQDEMVDSLQIALLEKPPIYNLDRVIANRAFQVGEKLTFNIRYGIIKAGEATMEVRDIVNVRDSIPAYHIVTTARSAKFFDAFYKVRDQVETFLDARGIFSWKFQKRLREGGYKFDLLVDYYQKHGIAHVEGIRYDGEDEALQIRDRKEFHLKIPEYVLDVLAAFYYVRTQKLEVGMPIYMANHDNKEVYNLQVIIQKRERVKVDAGTFNCIMIQPRLQGEAIFKQKGELWVWLTDDEYKIPVQMKSKVAVGSITTELKQIEGLPLPLKSQVK